MTTVRGVEHRRRHLIRNPPSSRANQCVPIENVDGETVSGGIPGVRVPAALPRQLDPGEAHQDAPWLAWENLSPWLAPPSVEADAGVGASARRRIPSDFRRSFAILSRVAHESASPTSEQHESTGQNSVQPTAAKRSCNSTFTIPRRARGQRGLSGQASSATAPKSYDRKRSFPEMN